jgi:hypothetical protein
VRVDGVDEKELEDAAFHGVEADRPKARLTREHREHTGLAPRSAYRQAPRLPQPHRNDSPGGLSQVDDVHFHDLAVPDADVIGQDQVTGR